MSEAAPQTLAHVAPSQWAPGLVLHSDRSERLDDARADLLRAVEARLIGLVDAERTAWCHWDGADEVLAALADLIAAGGKRTRPGYCVTGFLAAGGDPADPRIVPTASALEMLHVFALLQDDVMDESPLRRGRPTAHERYAEQHRAAEWHGRARRFGESTAVLAGDMAAIYADRLMVGSAPSVQAAWNDLRCELVIGQYMDLRACAVRVLDVGLSERIAAAKSGRYTVHRPMLLGALTAGRPDLAPSYEAFGTSVGMAFQLRDDMIDLLGSPETAGKPTGQDLAGGKMTLLLALAAEHSDEVRRAVEGPSQERSRLRALLTNRSVIEHLESCLEHLVLGGCAALDSAAIPDHWRSELVRMAHRSGRRTS